MEEVVQITFDSAAWVFASAEVCKREQIAPNALVYNESSATLGVFVKRSSGGDFALSQGGLNYLLKGLDHGALKDGSPVRSAIIVLADVDSQQRVKLVKQWSAKEMRDRFIGIKPIEGKLGLGAYWWITASDNSDDWYFKD